MAICRPPRAKETVPQKTCVLRSLPVSGNHMVPRGTEEEVQEGGSQANSSCEERDLLRMKVEILGNQPDRWAGEKRVCRSNCS